MKRIHIPFISDDTINPSDPDELSRLVERADDLESQKSDVNDQLKAVYAEAKDHGYDKKAFREVVKVKRMAIDERQDWRQRRETVEEYISALGGLADLPLGRAAAGRYRTQQL